MAVFSVCTVVSADSSCNAVSDRIPDLIRSVIPYYPYRSECNNDYIINLYNRSIQYRDPKEWRLMQSIHLRTGAMLL